MRNWKIGLIAAFMCSTSCLSQQVIYVDIDAPPGGDGASWGTAFDDLHEALFATQDGDELWIAEGVYETRGQSFRIDAPDLAMLGGFDGTETDRDQRNWIAHQSILRGTQESRVITCDTLSAKDSLTLDGFLLEEGNVNGLGGALLSVNANTSIRNCVCFGNNASSGGAVAVIDAVCEFRNCDFLVNSSQYGGAIYLGDSSTSIHDSTFVSNFATVYGGAIYGRTLQSKVEGSRFLGNSSVSGAGALFLDCDGESSIDNCEFTQNLGTGPGGAMWLAAQTGRHLIHSSTLSWNYGAGGGLYTDAREVMVSNCVIWNNIGGNIAGTFAPSVSFSCIGGGYPGEGNISSDPRMVDAFNGDLRLLSDSPCIDAGNNDIVPPDITTDLDGNPRFVDDPNTPDTGVGTPPLVDMGAYEFQVDTLTLDGPVPGLAAQDNMWTVSDATPGARIYFAYGFDAGSTDIPFCPGVNAGIEKAVLFGEADANASGVAEWTTFVPSVATGQSVLFQAVEISSCTASSVVPFVFP